MKLIITDEELNNSLNPISEVKEAEIVNSVGTGNGSHERINPLTKELAILEATFGDKSLSEVARIHNISKQSLSSLTKNPPSEIAEKISNKRADISNAIQDKLLATLSVFQPEDLETKMVPYSINALAGALERVESVGAQQGSNVQYIIYAPQVRKEEDYKVIDIGDQ